jgi:hypothetical protein
MTSSPSRSSKRGEVVDEFWQHDGMVTVVVKLLCRALPKRYGDLERRSKLEAEGVPAHGL